MKLPKTYEPAQYENDIYALWEKSGAFEPKSRGSKSKFSMVAPPPNANGNLHLGHALTNAIQDILSRYHRMKGEATLYLPGADHAGFETWVVYEKQLAKEGKSRFDYKREELYSQVWDFVQQNKDNFENQYRALGASFDWSRFTFTLDDKVVERAYATFKKMWKEKLIYRGERLVNYCTFHRTSFADIEVEYEENTTPLYYMKYGPFTVATTRPETKFGDTAVAVHPDDERYNEWVGKVVTVEGVNGPFELRVVADEMVDPDFGTGVVKITPAHDYNDWEVAQRHNLPAKRVINHDGTMNHETGKFAGMTVIEARKAVVDALKEKGLLVKVDKDYKNRVGFCYKCGSVIEPMLMEQWFVDMEPLAEKAIKALEAGDIKFHPSSKRKQLTEYLKKLRDWNISRQIAWGIPIPAFQNIDDSDDWIYDERIEEEIIEVNGKKYRRDPDVFDTWFSSGQWPFVTLDYPDSDDYKQFYPLDLMETGFDILYQWVGRMIMLGIYVTGKVPFENVYLHGLVLDKEGQKMSKSKGNVINPMEIVEEYGSDALRMGLITGQTPGVNQPFGTPKVVAARNFCNKLWNVARFVEGKLGEEEYESKPKAVTPADEWILEQTRNTVKQVPELLDKYRFSEAYESVYHFLWDDFADWYIEASKTHLNKSVLAYVLESTLKIAHPFAPFVTETIWQTLKSESDGLLIISNWPESVKGDKKKAKEFEEVKDIISEIRFIKSTLSLKSGPNLYHTGDKFIDENKSLIKDLADLDDVKEVTDGQGLHLTGTNRRCWLDLDQQTTNQFIAELKNKIQEHQQSVDRLEARLANDSYVKNAPKEIVEETKSQLEGAKTRLEKAREEHGRFTSS